MSDGKRLSEVKPKTPRGLVVVLESLLARAKNNELREMLIVALHHDKAYSTAWSGESSLVEKLGMLEALKYDILAHGVREEG